MLAVLYKRLEAAVARILAVFLIVSKRPADLMRLEIAAKYRSGGYSGSAVKSYSVLQEDIQHPAGEKPAHGSAFHYQSFFHSFSPLFIPVPENPVVSKLRIILCLPRWTD